MTTRSPDAPTLTPAQLAAHLAALPDAVAVPATVRGLMVEFPLHSEWVDTEDMARNRVVVVGYPIGGTTLAVEYTNRRPDPDTRQSVRIGLRHARNAYVRVNPPAPCPVTKEGNAWRDVTSDVLKLITLHPAEPGATEGRYTWAVTP